jgi:hypothetical protein
MIFIKEHFDKILEAYDKDYKKMDNAWGNQRDPNNFSKQISSIEPKISSLQIPEDVLKSFNYKKISRQELSDLKGSNFRKIIAILAWGGMREKHFIACISGMSHGNFKKDKNNNRYVVENLEGKDHGNIHDIERVVDKITNDKYVSRADIYNDFFKLDLKGCGPAYFTKIMFFFSKKFDCFIMDQWTSRSINLLLGKNLIKLDNRVTVNKKKYNDGQGNTGDVYEKFCNSVEILCNEINKTSRTIKPEETEQLIFSRGGGLQKKAFWRGYLIKNS